MLRRIPKLLLLASLLAAFAASSIPVGLSHAATGEKGGDFCTIKFGYNGCTFHDGHCNDVGKCAKGGSCLDSGCIHLGRRTGP